MQKVERRMPRGRRIGRGKALAGMLAALVLLALGLIWLRQEQAPAGEGPKGAAGVELIPAAAGPVTELTLKLRGEEAWRAVRREDGGYSLAEDGSWTMDPLLTDPLVESLQALEYEEVLTEEAAAYEDRLADFGLADPEVEVAWRTEDGTERRVRIGDAVTGSEGRLHYMLLDGDARLLGVSVGLVQTLRVEKALLHPVEQPEIRTALLDRITVTGTDGRIAAEWTLAGAVTDADAGTAWRVTAPFVYAADEDAIRGLKENAGKLVLGMYLGEATEDRLADYSLAGEGESLTLHFAAGSTGTVSEQGVYDVQDWEEETLFFRIGAPVGEVTRAVRFGKEIATMSLTSLNAFLTTDPMDTAARYPVLTPLDSLESLTVETETETVTYVLEDPEGTDEKADGAQRRCLKNGTEISMDAFAAAYQRMLTVNCTGRLPEDAVCGPAHQKYAFRTVNGGMHTVELCTFDSMHDAVVVDGAALFYLIRGGMPELP